MIITPKAIEWKSSDTYVWTRNFIEQNFLIAEPSNPPGRAYDSTGQSYTVLTLGGIKPEGQPAPGAFYTESYVGVRSGFELLGLRILEFLNGKTHIIWRQRPEVHMEQLTVPNFDSLEATKTMYVCYYSCRLAAY